MELDFNDVLKKMQELYPSQTAHAIAETKVEMLARRVEELERDDKAPE